MNIRTCKEPNKTLVQPHLARNEETAFREIYITVGKNDWCRYKHPRKIGLPPVPQIWSIIEESSPCVYLYKNPPTRFAFVLCAFPVRGTIKSRTKYTAVVPQFVKRLYKHHYSGHPALLNRRYRRISVCTGL